MAYIINTGDSSGYTRADFLSALNGLQPLLQSGTNIKTINSQSVLGSGNISVTVTPQEYPQEALLTASEKEKRAATLARIDELNPIVNGKRKYMMFGFISDLHTMPTQTDILAVDNTEMQNDITAMLNADIVFPNWEGEGNVTNASSIASHIKSAWPSSDESYYGASAEQDIRLLGAIAFAADFDAVFCGGDLSSGRLPYNCYSYMLYQMKKMFDKYITVPHYFTDGNHDRRYSTSVAHRSNTEWCKWLNLLNSNGATYITANESRYGDKSNTYYVDFSSRKIRAIMQSKYEQRTDASGNGSSPYGYNYWDCFCFDNPQDATEWTVMVVAHYVAGLSDFLYYYRSGERIGNVNGNYWGGTTGYVSGIMNPDTSTTNSSYNSQYASVSKNAQYGSGYRGKATIGGFSGHVHTNAEFTVTASNDKNYLGNLSIWNSNDSGYTFSIFIVDDDNYQLHWLLYSPDYGADKVPTGFDRTAKEFTLDYRHN